MPTLLEALRAQRGMRSQIAGRGGMRSSVFDLVANRGPGAATSFGPAPVPQAMQAKNSPKELMAMGGKVMDFLKGGVKSPGDPGTPAATAAEPNAQAVQPATPVSGGALASAMPAPTALSAAQTTVPAGATAVPAGPVGTPLTGAAALPSATPAISAAPAAAAVAPEAAAGAMGATGAAAGSSGLLSEIGGGLYAAGSAIGSGIGSLLAMI